MARVVIMGTSQMEDLDSWELAEDISVPCFVCYDTKKRSEEAVRGDFKSIRLWALTKPGVRLLSNITGGYSRRGHFVGRGEYVAVGACREHEPQLMQLNAMIGERTCFSTDVVNHARKLAPEEVQEV